MFYVSLEDKLMRLFASERIASVMDKLGFKDGEMIEHPMINRAIERAQKKVEENHFGVRKRLLEYDDVMNKQRKVVYERRRHALMGQRIGMDISNMMWDRVVKIIENNDYEGCKELFLTVFAMEYPFNAEEHEDISRDNREDRAFDLVMAKFKERGERLAKTAQPVIKDVYENRGHQYENILIPLTDGRRQYQISVPLKEAYETEGRNIVTAFEKAILLHTIDESWKENLRQLDELQHSVQNASYEQKDPLVIFKLESVTLFDNMINEINDNTVSVLMRVNLPMPDPEQVRQAQAQRRQQSTANGTGQQNLDELSDTQKAMQQAAASAGASRGRQQAQKLRTPVVNSAPKVGRNDPCPCGSGKKFKACHGKGVV